MSFNIYGDLENKLLSDDFVMYLKKHDIILLSETWTSKSSCIELEGLVKCPFSERVSHNKQGSFAEGSYTGMGVQDGKLST